MGKYAIEDSTLANIADAIREHNGETKTYTPGEMADAVRAFEKTEVGISCRSVEGGYHATVYKELFPYAFYLRNDIVSVSADGISNTAVPNQAFYSCSNLESVNLPEGITSIETQAFRGCSKLRMEELPAGITEIGANAFLDCGNLALTELPAGITKLNSGTFNNCSALAIMKLPAGVTEIGRQAFSGCSAITITELPSTLYYIDANAFQNCTGLTKLTWTYKAETSYADEVGIAATAFTGCTNLTEINVPWSEGEVLNAPWGAANATINYNYTGA